MLLQTNDTVEVGSEERKQQLWAYKNVLILSGGEK